MSVPVKRKCKLLVICNSHAEDIKPIAKFLGADDKKVRLANLHQACSQFKTIQELIKHPDIPIVHEGFEQKIGQLTQIKLQSLFIEQNFAKDFFELNSLQQICLSQFLVSTIMQTLGQRKINCEKVWSEQEKHQNEEELQNFINTFLSYLKSRGDISWRESGAELSEHGLGIFRQSCPHIFEFREKAVLKMVSQIVENEKCSEIILVFGNLHRSGFEKLLKTEPYCNLFTPEFIDATADTDFDPKLSGRNIEQYLQTTDDIEKATKLCTQLSEKNTSEKNLIASAQELSNLATRFYSLKFFYQSAICYYTLSDFHQSTSNYKILIPSLYNLARSEAQMANKVSATELQKLLYEKSINHLLFAIKSIDQKQECLERRKKYLDTLNKTKEEYGLLSRKTMELTTEIKLPKPGQSV